MTSEYLWRDPEELRARDDLAEAKRAYEEAQDWPPKPYFDQKRFDMLCRLAEDRIDHLVETGIIPAIIPAVDTRLEVMKGYFLDYAERRCDAASIYDWALDDLATMRDDPGIALYALEMVKAGFLAMGESGMAREFGHAAAATVRRLGMQRQLRALLKAGED